MTMLICIHIQAIFGDDQTYEIYGNCYCCGQIEAVGTIEETQAKVLKALGL